MKIRGFAVAALYVEGYKKATQLTKKTKSLRKTLKRKCDKKITSSAKKKKSTSQTKKGTTKQSTKKKGTIMKKWRLFLHCSICRCMHCYLL